MQSENQSIERLKKRADFLRTQNKGLRVVSSQFLLFGFRRSETDASLSPRMGYTISKKVGIAVIRNKIRRRLKEWVRLNSTLFLFTHMDYVLLPRSSVLETSFEELSLELAQALAKLHKRIGFEN